MVLFVPHSFDWEELCSWHLSWGGWGGWCSSSVSSSGQQLRTSAQACWENPAASLMEWHDLVSLHTQCWTQAGLWGRIERSPVHDMYVVRIYIYRLATYCIPKKDASLNGHNFSSVSPTTLIFWFSESLEGARSDGVLKSQNLSRR